MQALIQRAQQAQFHVLIGCIDATNQASISLHEKMGFTHTGTFKQVGFKFGQWLDAAFYQLVLILHLNQWMDRLSVLKIGNGQIKMVKSELGYKLTL